MNPRRSLRKVLAYARKEYQIQRSYRFAFLLSVFGICTSLATYFFIDRALRGPAPGSFGPYGTSYFAYVLVGNAFFAYVGTALSGTAGRIAQEQQIGTLEALLVTPTSVPLLVFSMVVWNSIYASCEVVLYFLVGALGFGVDLSGVCWTSLGVLLVLVMIVFNSIGLVEAACILVLKRGTVAAWASNGLLALLGGVFFPVHVLPPLLRHVSDLLPVTHAIRGLQMAIYRGATPYEVGHEIRVLGGFCVVLAPLGIWSLGAALRRARRDGSLCQY